MESYIWKHYLGTLHLLHLFYFGFRNTLNLRPRCKNRATQVLTEIEICIFRYKNQANPLLTY